MERKKQRDRNSKRDRERQTDRNRKKTRHGSIGNLFLGYTIVSTLGVIKTLSLLRSKHTKTGFITWSGHPRKPKLGHR